jgi:hypothetical protein
VIDAGAQASATALLASARRDDAGATRADRRLRAPAQAAGSRASRARAHGGANGRFCRRADGRWVRRCLWAGRSPGSDLACAAFAVRQLMQLGNRVAIQRVGAVGRRPFDVVLAIGRPAGAEKMPAGNPQVPLRPDPDRPDPEDLPRTVTRPERVQVLGHDAVASFGTGSGPIEPVTMTTCRPSAGSALALVPPVVVSGGQITSQLPSITDLTAQTGLAVGTVRRAVDILVKEGLVQTVPGRGTFVTR